MCITVGPASLCKEALLLCASTNDEDTFMRVVSRTELTVAQIKEQLSYNADTGIFTWNLNRPGVKKGRVAGGKTSLGYWAIKLFSTFHCAHRLAWFYVHGVWPPAGMDIDHIDGERSNNAIKNLRLATRSQNALNAKASTKKKSTHLKGASWRARSSKPWTAMIEVNGKRIHLGVYATAEEAHAAYRKAAIKYAKEFARFK